jgi:hypothetical protein
MVVYIRPDSVLAFENCKSVLHKARSGTLFGDPTKKVVESAIAGLAGNESHHAAAGVITDPKLAPGKPHEHLHPAEKAAKSGKDGPRIDKREFNRSPEEPVVRDKEGEEVIHKTFGGLEAETRSEEKKRMHLKRKAAMKRKKGPGGRGRGGGKGGNLRGADERGEAEDVPEP